MMDPPRRIYDLSQPVFTNCPQYPDENPRPAQIRWLYMQPVQGVNKEIAEISTHTGTHCDAPFHFVPDGVTIDRVPLEKWVAPAVVLDFRHKPAGSSIGPDDLSPHSSALRAGDVVLLNTGRGQRRDNTAEFLTEYVHLSGDGARWLLDRDVEGVGIDAVSLGAYRDAGDAARAHRAMLENDKIIVEELYFPDEVMDGRRRLFVAVPIKLRGCSGAWARAMLWE